mmetsp:Transcript_21824/g.68338  ORF Transcript_21824/g.68338 Transcript_21824/m.68338 type:complete len:212 (+) Transcript_21824:1-636(+)
MAIRCSSGRTMAPWVATMWGCLKRRRTRSSLLRSWSCTEASSSLPRGVLTATYIPQKMPFVTSPKLPKPRLAPASITTSSGLILHRSASPTSATSASWDWTSTPSRRSAPKTVPECAVVGTEPSTVATDSATDGTSRARPSRLASRACSRANSASHRRHFSLAMLRKALRSPTSASRLLAEAPMTRAARQTPFTYGVMPYSSLPPTAIANT